MRTLTALAVAAIILAMSILSAGWGLPDGTATSRTVVGKWLGTLVDEGAEVRFAFEIAEAKGGGYTAVLHAVDQAESAPWTSVTVKGDSLRLEMGSAFAYEGKLQPDGNTIGLIGHSEGGAVAPMAAVRSHEVAFLVLLGAPGLSLYEGLVLQDGTEAKAAGKTDREVELIRGFSRRYYGIVLRSKDAAEVERETKALYAALTEEEKAALAVFGWPDLYGSLNLSWGLRPESRKMLRLEPGATLRQVRCPVLVLIGEKDSQVPPKENLSAIERELKAGGNPDHTLRELSGLNHMLQTCDTDETMSPAVPQIIADWITARSRTAVASR